MASLSAEALAVDTKLTELLSGTPSEFAASVYDQSLPTNDCVDQSIPTLTSSNVCIEVISGELQHINSMQRTINILMDKILQLDGVGKEWQAADKTSRRLKEVVTLLEDIYCNCLLGDSVLVDLHRKGGLLFQLYA